MNLKINFHSQFSTSSCFAIGSLYRLPIYFSRKHINFIFCTFASRKPVLVYNDGTEERWASVFSHVYLIGLAGLFGISSARHVHMYAIGDFYASIQPNSRAPRKRGRRGRGEKWKNERKKGERERDACDSMRSQRKCKSAATAGADGNAHPAGSKNSPRRYCSLVACPMYGSARILT